MFLSVLIFDTANASKAVMRLQLTMLELLQSANAALWSPRYAPYDNKT